MGTAASDAVGPLDHSSEPADRAGDAATLLQVLWHRRLLIVGSMLACLAIAGLYLLIATPIYSSTAQLYIDSSAPKPFSEGSAGAQEVDGYLNSQADILQSEPVMKRALDTVGWRRLKTFSGANDDPVAWLQHSRRFKISVEVVKKTNLVSVTMESPYPGEAAALVNAITEAYIAQRAAQGRATGTEMIRALEQQRADLERQRQECVAGMLRFKNDHGVTSFHDDKSNVAMARTAALSAQLSATEMEVWELGARSAAVRAALARPGALAAFVEAQQYKDKQAADHEYDDLRSQLVQGMLALGTSATLEGGNNVRVRVLQNQIAILKQRIALKEQAIAQAYLADLSVQLETAKQKQNELRAAMAEQQRQMAALDPLAAQYAKLESQANRLQKEDEMLEGRISEVRVNSSAGPLNVEIAEPGRTAMSPVKPRKSLVLGAAALIGWLLGVGIALVGELQGPRLRSADEVRIALRTPVVAMVPRINPRLSPVARGQMVHLDPRSPVAEVYRSIRTSLNLGTGGKAKTILIASPAAGDGKSTTASNLAIAFAQAGQRTLIVDCDLREPVQHLIFETDGIVGLCSVIAGEARLRDAIRPTRIPGLRVLPCGPLPCNPSELLSGHRFGQMMAALSRRFDRIIIDSPPLTNVADARVLAAGADATLLVLRMNRSIRQSSVRALDGLQKVGARVLGAIANDMPAGHGYHYYGGSWQYASHVKHLMLGAASASGDPLAGRSASHASLGSESLTPDTRSMASLPRSSALSGARPDGANGTSAAVANGHGTALAAESEIDGGFDVEEPDWSSELPPAAFTASGQR